MDFNNNLDDLVIKLNSTKGNISKYLRKHFIENIDYIEIRKIKINVNHGGNNKITFKLTKSTFELISNSYNIKNSHVLKINNIKLIHPIIMSIEKATILFIEKSFNKITKINREFIIGPYRIDLYFPEYKIAIECDEYNHKNYDRNKEEDREKYIKNKLDCIFIRYDPTVELFDLSNIISILLIKILN